MGGVATTEAMSIDELLDQSPELIPMFIQHGMQCVGCPMARFETVEDACRIYGLALGPFLADMAALSSGRGPRATPSSERN